MGLEVCETDISLIFDNGPFSDSLIEYQLAVDLYTNAESAPLTPTQVEDAVVEAIFTAYDNASNGNRTRGGMKKAYEM